MLAFFVPLQPAVGCTWLNQASRGGAAVTLAAFDNVSLKLEVGWMKSTPVTRL